MKEKLETDVYFTPREAAKHLHLSLSAIKNYIYANKLKTLKTPGGHHRISKSNLLVAMGEEGKVFVRTEAAPISIEPSCSALLNVFKLWGTSGNMFIMHSRRVADISYRLSKALRFTDEEANYIKMAGLVHDIGHMAIDRHILLRTGSLTSEEYELIKLHPTKGEELLSSIKELKDIGSIIVQHHESIDGTGYPEGLTGRAIRKEARILSIAEAYDSMVSEYSYKRPVSKEAAMSELMKQRGFQFDKQMVDIFLKII